MHEGPTTNASLVLRLRDREDETAWSEFVQIYQPLIRNLVRRKGFQDADAAELTQDVLLAVMRAVKRFEPDRKQGSFRGWLFTIARRLMINFLSSPARRLRGSGRTSVLEQLLEHPAKGDAESQAFDLELKRQLFGWAARLVKESVEPTTWEAFWRTAVLAVPVTAVGDELHLKPGAVYVAKSRVMRQLREVIEKQLGSNDLSEVSDD